MNLPGLAEDALRQAGIPFNRLSGIQMNRTPLGGHCGIFMIFTDGAPQPSFVLRVSRDPGQVASFEVSYQNLQALQAALPPAFHRSVPTPLLLEARAGLTCFLESALPGTPIKKLPPNRYFRSNAFALDFEAVVDWVVVFNTALGVDSRSLTDAWQTRLLRDPIADYRDRFTVSPALDGLLDETAAVLRDAALTLAPRHADFCAANVLIDRGHTVRVIDWEQKLSPTWPFGDLLHFMNSVWCMPHGRGVAAQERNYRALFFTPTPLTSPLQRGVRRYTERLGITPRLLLPLSVMAWVQHALYKAASVSRLSASPDEEEALMPYVHHITIINRDQCLNLEVLAAERDRYVFALEGVQS